LTLIATFDPAHLCAGADELIGLVGIAREDMQALQGSAAFSLFGRPLENDF